MKEELKEFEKFLEGKGFSKTTPTGRPSTVSDYPWRIKKILKDEDYTLDYFIDHINQMVVDYDKNGKKEAVGNQSSRAVFNAVKYFKEFLQNRRTQVDMIQKIFFGAPGTGKSHRIDAPEAEGGLGLKSVPSTRKFRTTFHPDYDYAQFVGSYKPVKLKDKVGNPILVGGVPQIGYEFVPQVFAKAYIAAWKEYLKAKENPAPVYLVVEEINRGNCAQIFGDIFQLLDRNEDGESQYEIDVDSDFAEWLGESKIKLPPNFNILATMNTSDQSLFPMDSAFKRRFDWEYVAINYNQEKANFKVQLKQKGDEKILFEFAWLHFLKKVNADIYKVTESEDKQMGEFFVKPKDGVIGLDMFRSKILFYLWDSVYKDEPDKKNVFHFDYPEKSGSKVTFQSLFSDDAKAIEIINQMMKNLDEAYESKDDSEFKDFKILK